MLNAILIFSALLQLNESGGWTPNLDDLMRLVDQTTPLEVILRPIEPDR
jgi:hypothetical protein